MLNTYSNAKQVVSAFNRNQMNLFDAVMARHFPESVSSGGPVRKHFQIRAIFAISFQIVLIDSFDDVFEKYGCICVGWHAFTHVTGNRLWLEVLKIKGHLSKRFESLP